MNDAVAHNVFGAATITVGIAFLSSYRSGTMPVDTLSES